MKHKGEAGGRSGRVTLVWHVVAVGIPATVIEGMPQTAFTLTPAFTHLHLVIVCDLASG